MTSSIKAMAAAREAEQPPLYPNTPIYPIYATPTIRRDTERPSQCYLDITFLDHKADGLSVQNIEAIIFKNYYTASIMISMLNNDKGSTGIGGTFVTILDNRVIMPSPYFENGSQNWVAVKVNEFNNNYVPGKPLRITLIQPNPVWKEFDIRHICAVGKTTANDHVIALADGGISGLDVDAIAAWRNKSLSSLIKADTMFLARARLIRESAQKEDMSKATLSKGAKGSDSSLGKSKMGKKKNDKPKSGISLVAGGTRKEVVVMDPQDREQEPDDT